MLYFSGYNDMIDLSKFLAVRGNHEKDKRVY